MTALRKSVAKIVATLFLRFNPQLKNFNTSRIASTFFILLHQIS